VRNNIHNIINGVHISPYPHRLFPGIGVNFGNGHAVRVNGFSVAVNFRKEFSEGIHPEIDPFPEVLVSEIPEF
jgi:hypothetical protein